VRVVPDSPEQAGDLRSRPDEPRASDIEVRARDGNASERRPGTRPSESDALRRDGARALAPLAGDDTVYSLLASARHELRSPLQSIQGFAELLSSESYGPLGDEQHTFVQHILQGSIELGSVVEACLELAEVELIGRMMEPVRTDLRSALTDALDPGRNGSTAVIDAQFAPATQTALARFDRAVLRRGVHALLTALGTGISKSFQARVELIQDHGRLRLTRVVADGAVPDLNAAKPAEGADSLLSVAELSRRRRATRSLIWLRLANALLAMQDGELLVSEQLDRAEVRFRLSSTH
jgi:signal transduction histidine kinase